MGLWRGPQISGHYYDTRLAGQLPKKGPGLARQADQPSATKTRYLYSSINFFKDATRRHTWPALPAPPISPNFLAKLGKPRIDAAIFLPSDSDLTEIITRQRGPYVHDNGLFLFRHHFST